VFSLEPFPRIGEGRSTVQRLGVADS